MEENKSKKMIIIVAIIMALIVITALGICFIVNIESKSNEVNNIDKISENNASEQIKVSEKDKQIVKNYFEGKWTGTNCNKTIIINSDMTFSIESDSGVEKGTFTVKDATSEDVAHIILNYSSGTKIDFKLVQGANSQLWSDDTEEKYEYYVEENNTVSEDDKELVENYFKGKWTGTNCNKTIIINSDMTFSVESGSGVEKGTFTVKDAASEDVAHIILNYSSGTKIDFKLVQGANSQLWSDDTEEKYEYEN